MQHFCVGAELNLNHVLRTKGLIMKTRKIAVVVALACGMGLSAGGAAAGPADWAGPYIGGHAGYGLASGVEFDLGGGNTSSSFDMTGYMIGLQGGYNWAVGGVVVGVEADASYADIKGDASCPNPSFTCGAKMDQLITIRGRVGVPINMFLLYGALGFASGQVEAEVEPATGNDSTRATGFVVGLGGELAFNKNLSGRVELQYVDLGSNDYVITGGPFSMETKATALRVGANWRF